MICCRERLCHSVTQAQLQESGLTIPDRSALRILCATELQKQQHARPINFWGAILDEESAPGAAAPEAAGAAAPVAAPGGAGAAAAASGAPGAAAAAGQGAGRPQLQRTVPRQLSLGDWQQADLPVVDWPAPAEAMRLAGLAGMDDETDDDQPPAQPRHPGMQAHLAHTPKLPVCTPAQTATSELCCCSSKALISRSLCSRTLDQFSMIRFRILHPDSAVHVAA